MRRTPVLLCVGLTLACTPIQATYLTPSGKPEVDIGGATKTQVKDALVSVMIQSGYTVKASGDYVLSFDTPASGLANALFSSRYDSQALYRSTVDFFGRSAPASADAISA